MDDLKTLNPTEIQFRDEEDVKKYSDRWWVYDEAAIIRMPARKLIELEMKLGMGVYDVMNGARARTVLGNVAAAWIAIHLADPDLAGEFDEFNPLIMMAEWRPHKGKGQGVTEEAPIATDMLVPEEDDSPKADPSPNTISDQTDTVVLRNLPVVG